MLSHYFYRASRQWSLNDERKVLGGRQSNSYSIVRWITVCLRKKYHLFYHVYIHKDIQYEKHKAEYRIVSKFCQQNSIGKASSQRSMRSPHNKFSRSWGLFRAGPVIQANGRLTFEDDLRSGGLL